MGPGYQIDLQTTLTFHPGDLWYAQVNPAVGNFICAGASSDHFVNSGSVLLGITLPPFFNSGHLEQYVAPGATVSLQCALTDSAGVARDNVLSLAWVWDPVGGLYTLLSLAAGATSPFGLLQTTYKNHP